MNSLDIFEDILSDQSEMKRVTDLVTAVIAELALDEVRLGAVFRLYLLWLGLLDLNCA